MFVSLIAKFFVNLLELNKLFSKKAQPQTESQAENLGNGIKVIQIPPQQLKNLPELFTLARDGLEIEV